MDTKADLTHRQAKILAAIVKENCDSGVPVASRDIVEKYDFGLSPATIRNEMMVLEELGYIAQPHTSAGRVPTDKGFRYFVNELMDKVQLTLKEQASLREEVLKLQLINAEVGRRLAKLVAAHTAQASFAILPEEISTVGLSNILENPQLPAEDAREIAQFFDNLDEYAENMLQEYSEEVPQAFIGKEFKLSKRSDYSVIVSGVRLPSGEKGVIGVIGPKAMPYPKHMSLLEYLSKLIAGGTLIALFFIIR